MQTQSHLVEFPRLDDGNFLQNFDDFKNILDCQEMPVQSFSEPAKESLQPNTTSKSKC